MTGERARRERDLVNNRHRRNGSVDTLDTGEPQRDLCNHNSVENDHATPRGLGQMRL